MQNLQNRLLPLQPDSSSRFLAFSLSEAQVEFALRSVDITFLAYLQNKVEAQATAYLEMVPVIDPDPAKQMKHIAQHIEIRAAYFALSQLVDEIVDAQRETVNSETDENPSSND